MRPVRLALAGLALGALAVAPGCDRTSVTNAGLTNGPPPTTSREKAADRTDIPASGTPRSGESLGAAGDIHTTAGPAGEGGGSGGGSPDQPRLGATAKPDDVRANPPAKTGSDPSSAAGGTKPAEVINSGTPRSPH